MLFFFPPPFRVASLYYIISGVGFERRNKLKLDYKMSSHPPKTKTRKTNNNNHKKNNKTKQKETNYKQFPTLLIYE